MTENNYVGIACTASKTAMLEMKAVKTVAKIMHKNESLMIMFSSSILR